MIEPYDERELALGPAARGNGAVEFPGRRIDADLGAPDPRLVTVDEAVLQVDEDLHAPRGVEGVAMQRDARGGREFHARTMRGQIDGVVARP